MAKLSLKNYRSIVTGIISLIGILIPAWLNYKMKIAELGQSIENRKPNKKKNRYLIIFSIIIFILSVALFFNNSEIFNIKKQNQFDGAIRFETIDGNLMAATFSNIRDISVIQIAEKGNFRLKEIYPQGTQFRMYLKSNENAYLYAIAASPENQISIIYPYTETVETYFEKNDAEIIIPSATHAMQINGKAGIDLFCLLYCKEKIDIYKLKYELEQYNISLPESLNKAIADKIVEPDKIKFEPNKIAFTAQSKKTIVPIIIAIEHK